MTESDGGVRKDFFPPTSLEKSVRDIGADAVRYRVDYIMLTMGDGARLATVVIRPWAEGRYPAMMIRSPYRKPRFISSSRPCASISLSMTTC